MGTFRALIICKSVHHQNTARVAQAMAEVLQARVVEPAAAGYQCLADFDWIGIGSGIYFGRFHSELRKWVEGMPPALVNHPKMFLFSTAGLSRLWRCWHWPLKRVLSRKGYRIEKEFHCCGFDSFGPLALIGGINLRRPNSHDLQLAREFAESLRSKA